MPSNEITVGMHSLSMDDAAEIITQYTGNVELRRKRRDFYAWPYYDQMDTGSAASELNDGDLLAPVLLNVNPGIHGLASLQECRPALVTLLHEVPENLSLDDVDATEDVIDQVAKLFSVLDTHDAFGIGGTTLSKVLHRKRPALIPLHDTFVRQAYVPERIEPARSRSWERYVRLLVSEMKADLCASPACWKTLAAIPARGGLTALRALDIVAWHQGKASSRGGH